MAFRADASMQVGTGHVMRSLTLADSLRERGAVCSFFCRSHQGHLLDLIAQRGHQALALTDLDRAKPNLNGTTHADWLGTDWTIDASDTQRALNHLTGGAPVDWLVVDHYALDASWEEALRPLANRIMVIDDLADRSHACDLLLDQNLGRDAQEYKSLLKGKPIAFIGPQYALLRPEFAALRTKSLARRRSKPRLRRLLITMGGVDRDNTTGQVLAALQSCTLPADLRINVVLGSYAPCIASVRAQATQMPWQTKVLVGVNNMAWLMAESDLAIGAAGSTSWERCCLGLPTIQIALAQNQVAIAKALGHAGAALMLDKKAIALSLSDHISNISNAEKLYSLSLASSSITQGKGAQIVSNYMKVTR